MAAHPVSLLGQSWIGVRHPRAILGLTYSLGHERWSQFRLRVLDHALQNEFVNATGCMANFDQVYVDVAPRAVFLLESLENGNCLLHRQMHAIGPVHLHHHVLKVRLLPHPYGGLGLEVSQRFVFKVI
jgi:hypothetical protein